MSFITNLFESNNLPLGMLVFNADNICVQANDEYSRISGYPAAELLNKPSNFFSLFVSTEINNSNLKHYSSTLIKKDGCRLPVQVYLHIQKIKTEKFITLLIKTLVPNIQTQIGISLVEEVFKQSKEAIVITDTRGKILNVNEKFSAITGYSKEEAVSKTPAILKSGKHSDSFYKDFWRKLKKEGTWSGEIWNKRKNGDVYPEWLHISSIRNEENKITHYIAQFSDMTKRKQSEEENLFKTYHDPLTGLPNRHLLFEEFKTLCNIRLSSPTKFAILFCDVDRFKLINDSLGHQAGDDVLIAIANRIKSNLRNNDFICRSGGDEFIIIMKGSKADQNLSKICQQILDLFKDPIQTNFGEHLVSMSIGVSRYEVDSKDVKELISFADSTMIKVKEKGGNDFDFFNFEEKSSIKQKIQLEREITTAIKENQFEVWYQPQIDTETNNVYGVECLLRWNHPEQGLIPPDIFIPIAESNGAIRALGYFVLQTASKQLKQWRVNNTFTGILAINISIRQFDRNNLIPQLREVLTEYMIPGSALELEVTESLFQKDNSHLIPSLLAIRELGIKVAIDDFGTGYSSLQRLKTLPVDNVKIDKCFIDDIVNSTQDASIVGVVTSLSKEFNFNLIAEGIETIDQAEKLNTLGCNKHQGYLYSKPVRAKEFETWLNDFNSNNKNGCYEI